MLDPHSNPFGLTGASGSPAPQPPFFITATNLGAGFEILSAPSSPNDAVENDIEKRAAQLGPFLAKHSPTESLVEVADLVSRISADNIRDSRLSKLLDLASSLVDVGGDIQHAKRAHTDFLRHLVQDASVSKIDLARAYESYAGFLITNAEHGEAIGYAEKSLYLRDEVHGANPFIQVGLRFCLSLLHARMGSHEKSATFLGNAYHEIHALMESRPLEAIGALRDFARSAIRYGRTDWSIAALESVNEVPEIVDRVGVKLSKTLAAVELAEIFAGLGKLDSAAKALNTAAHSLSPVEKEAGYQGVDLSLRIDVDRLLLSARSGRAVSEHSIADLLDQLNLSSRFVPNAHSYKVTLAECAYAAGHSILAIDLAQKALQSSTAHRTSAALVYRSHIVQVDALQSLGRFSDAAELLGSRAESFKHLSPMQQANLKMRRFESLISSGVSRINEEPVGLLREILRITTPDTFTPSRVGNGLRAKAFLYRALQDISRSNHEGAEHFLAQAQDEARVPGCFAGKAEHIGFSVCLAELLRLRGDPLQSLTEAEHALAMLSNLAGSGQPKPSVEYHRLLVLLEFFSDFGQPGQNPAKLEYYRQKRQWVEAQLNSRGA